MVQTEGHRLIDLAADLRKQGKLREAIAVFDQLIDKYSISDLYNERGVLHSGCRDFDRAIVDFTDGIGLNPTDADLFINRGNAYLWSGRFDLAVDDFSTAIGLSPSDAYAFNGRAQALAELGNIDDAIKDFHEAIRINANYVSPLFNLGVLLTKNGRLDIAYDYLNRAAELWPHDAETLCARGDLFSRAHKYQEALSDYRNAVAYNPDCVPALCRLSWLLSTISDNSIRDSAQALTLAKRCCELTSYGDGECLEVLARAYAELGDYESAAKCEAQAIQLIIGEQEVSLAQKRLRSYQSCRPPNE